MPTFAGRNLKTAGILAALTIVGIEAILGFPMKVPVGVVVQSLLPGLAAGLTAVALVLIYRTVRIINFAQLSLGAVAAQLFYEFYTRHILPFPIAIVTGLVAGVLVALLIGIISAALFFRHPRLVMTVVTILMTSLVAAFTGPIGSAFRGDELVTKRPPVIGPYPKVELTLAPVPFRIAHLVSFAMLLAIAIGLVVFFRRTRVGTAIRASAENSDRAALLGINVKLLQVGIWGLVGLIASVAAIAVQPVTQYSPALVSDQVGLLLPMAAAVLARMSSMPVAFFAGVSLYALRSSINYATGVSAILDLALFLVLMVAMLLQRKRILSTRVDDSTSWKAVKELRPTPREMLRVPGIRRSRRVLIFVTMVAVLGLPWVAGPQTTATFSQIWTTAIVALSLVVLTGWSGQISLGQFALVAVGSFVGGYGMLHWHLPFPVALIVAGAAGALAAVIIGLPALRIRGLFLAVTTFAIAIVTPLLFFDKRFLGDVVPTQDVTRPKFLFLSFENNRYMYYLALLLFLLVLLSVQALRRSRAGRVLIAIRDNESGVQSFGIDIVRTRLTAFALSGFIAAFAGCLLVTQNGGMARDTYNALASINIFILVVIGGVSTVMGAVLGAVYITGGSLLFPGAQTLVTGVTGVIVLMAIPGGLTQVVFGFRDAVLRVVAMRRNIIVPSLFADYSPEAWEKRLAPLSPAQQSQGLATLKPEQRYSLKSKIFGGAAV